MKIGTFIKDSKRCVVTGCTFTMCSFGSRLQSARVNALPSRKLRLESFSSSVLSASISSGRVLFM